MAATWSRRPSAWSIQTSAMRKCTRAAGKVMRAEPIAALYEQHRVHHAGAFPTLEDQYVRVCR